MRNTDPNAKNKTKKIEDHLSTVYECAYLICTDIHFSV